MHIHDSLIDLVGDTPLVRLRRLTARLRATVLVKVEYLNPGGSVKDRAATAMVLAAERDGTLPPGGTVVEASSGNTGIGMAQAAAIRGHRILVVLPNTVATEKLDILRGYGAEVVTTPGNVPREHPAHVNNLPQDRRGDARRVVRQPVRQPRQPGDPLRHHRPGDLERDRRSGDASRRDHRHGRHDLRDRTLPQGEGRRRGDRARTRPPPASTAATAGPYFVEAAGQYLHTDTVDDAWPLSYHQDVVDRIEAIEDRASLLTTRALAQQEGLLVGASSGLAVAAALRVARGLGPEHTVVALLPDSGRIYLSKYHSTDWLRRMGFLDDDRPGLLADATGAVRTVTTRTPLAEAARRRVAVGTGEAPAEALARLDDAGATCAVLLRDGRLAGLLTREELVARRENANSR
jgi:cystathionine beta-synthase